MSANSQPSRVFLLTPSWATMSTVRPFQLTDQDCKRYNFERLLHSNTSNSVLPIYDFFLFNNELDLLEIRLYELYNYVTFFLIVESRTTLSGKPKSLYLKDNWQKFEKYHRKIRRFEVDLDKNPRDQWANEIKLRNDGLHLALTDQTEDILLLTSDIDEIPKVDVLHALAACQLPNPFQSLVLVCAFYYYSFEYQHKGGTTDGPTVNLLRINRTDRMISPTGKGLRDDRFTYRHIPNACYHCSWCFDQINLTRNKIASFSHKELNKVRFHAQEHILNRYRHGKDLFDRHGEWFIRINNNEDIPELVKAQRDRFAYMINRSALVNVGFRDLSYDNHSQKQEQIS